MADIRSIRILLLPSSVSSSIFHLLSSISFPLLLFSSFHDYLVASNAWMIIIHDLKKKKLPNIHSLERLKQHERYKVIM